MPAASIPATTAGARPRGSRRLLILAGDARLVEEIRRGNEVAFEVVFERYGPAILGFCRHMLGSLEEAEDAVQHTFAAAHRDLLRDSEREIALKPWLFTIARNRCLSMLRARPERPTEFAELPTAGPAEQVEQRAELRQLLDDLRQLPSEQRAALLLVEIGDLSHSDVAGVLGCQAARVKALVFRARSGLIDRRAARETPCETIQEQLANLRGGALRRTQLRLHLRECGACRAYRAQIKQQRQQLSAALPVAPSLAFKSSVLAAAGIGGGSAGGGAAAAGLTSIAGAFSGATGGGALAKVAIVGLLAGGGAIAGQAALDSRQHPDSAPTPAPGSTQSPSVEGPSVTAERTAAQPAGHALVSGTRSGRSLEGQRSVGKKPAGRVGGRAGLPPQAGGRKRSTGSALPPGLATKNGGRALGHGPKAGPNKSSRAKARGPIDAPPASTPVRRGPPEPTAAPKARSSPPAKPAPNGKLDAATPGPAVDTPSPAAPSPSGKPQGKGQASPP